MHKKQHHIYCDWPGNLGRERGAASRVLFLLTLFLLGLDDDNRALGGRLAGSGMLAAVHCTQEASCISLVGARCNDAPRRLVLFLIIPGAPLLRMTPAATSTFFHREAGGVDQIFQWWIIPPLCAGQPGRLISVKRVVDKTPHTATLLLYTLPHDTVTAPGPADPRTVRAGAGT